MSAARVAALTLLLPLLALAHSGEPLQPHDLWSAWSFDPGVIAPLAITAVFYAIGARRQNSLGASQRAFF